MKTNTSTFLQPHRLLLDFWARFKGETLYLNSLYLIGSTGVMAALGFVYWLLAARLYTSAQVGIAVTLVSVMTYVSTISQFGMNVSLLRYLPSAKNPPAMLNTFLTIVIMVALIASTVFLIGAKQFVPSLTFIAHNPLIAVTFVVFLVFSALNVTLESMFIAGRNALSVFVKNAVFSVLKVAFLFVFIGFGAYGLFSSWAFSLALVIAGGLIWLAYKRIYVYKPRVDRGELRGVASYAGGNYIASLLTDLPQYVLPLMLTTLLSPNSTAYYNVAMSYSTLLFAIPMSVCNALFAEGANAEHLIRANTLRAIRLIAALLIPAIVVILLFGHWALSLFSAEYSENSIALLRILSVSSIFVAINTICWTILNLRRRVREIVVTLALNAGLVIVLSRLLIGQGVTGIGIAWIAAQALTSVVYLAMVYFRLRTPQGQATA